MNQQITHYRFLNHTLFYFFILISFRGCAQPTPALGSTVSSLASSGICSKEIWNIVQNPSVILENRQLHLGINYTCPFLLKSLQKQAVTGAVGIRNSQFNAGIFLQGNQHAKSTQTHVGYALKLTKGLSTGIQLGAQVLNYGNHYGRSILPKCNVGFLGEINKKWSFGGSIQYLSTSRYIQQPSTTLQLGCAYSPSEYLHCFSGVEKSPYLKPRVKLGLTYQVTSGFQLSGGIATSPANMAFGFKCNRNRWQLDSSCNYQVIIGWSPSVGFVYLLNQHE